MRATRKPEPDADIEMPMAQRTTPLDPAGAAAAAAAAVLYGSSYVATAIALRSFTPLTAALWRGALGVVALGLLLAVTTHSALRPRRITRSSAWRLLVLGGVGGSAFVLAMNTAVSLAGASITAFVAGLYAVLTALIAVPILHERLERLTLGALVLALVGAALLGELRLTGDQSLGVGVALVAAVLFATFLVLSRRWSHAYDLPGPAIGAAALGLTAVAAAVILPFSSAPAIPSPLRVDAVLGVAWLAIGPGAAAAIAVIIGMRRLEARRASAFLLLNPPTAAIGSWVLLGERFTLEQLLGAALILVAMALASGVLGRDP
jgi:drug/metabolite transporter (DMT)-like permease